MATVNVGPQNLNLVLTQGDDLSLQLDVVDGEGDPFDLTGYTASAQIRQVPSGTVAATFTASIGTASDVNLVLTKTQTSTLSGPLSWDCQVEFGTSRRTLVAGQVSVSPEVTRG
jgi:uncharacterized protein YfaS (alpha-2-macroglobulin family)